MLETAWLSLVMQHISSEVFVMDAETLHLIHTNEAACRRLGCDVSGVAALRLEDIFPEVSAQRIRQALTELAHKNVVK